MQLLPPTKTEPWKYTIVQRDLRPARDDAIDHHYQGSCIVLITGVPQACLDSDLRAYILYGLLSEYDNVLSARRDVDVVKKRLDVLQAKEDDLPHMNLDGDAEQQKEMRRKLAMAVEKHRLKLTEDLAVAEKRLRAREHALMSEPIEFNRVDPQDTTSEEVEWYAQFKSPRLRAEELIRTALQKSDWDLIRFARKKNQ